MKKEYFEAEGFLFDKTNGMSSWYKKEDYIGNMPGGYKIYSAEIIHCFLEDYNTIKVIANIEGTKEVLFEGFCFTNQDFQIILKLIGFK